MTIIFSTVWCFGCTPAVQRAALVIGENHREDAASLYAARVLLEQPGMDCLFIELPAGLQPAFDRCARNVRQFPGCLGREAYREVWHAINWPLFHQAAKSEVRFLLMDVDFDQQKSSVHRATRLMLDLHPRSSDEYEAALDWRQRVLIEQREEVWAGRVAESRCRNFIVVVGNSHVGTFPVVLEDRGFSVEAVVIDPPLEERRWCSARPEWIPCPEEQERQRQLRSSWPESE